MATISRLPVSSAFPSLIRTSILPAPAPTTGQASRLIAANENSAEINKFKLDFIALSKEQIGKIKQILETKDAEALLKSKAFSERTGIKSAYPMTDKESTEKAITEIGQVLRKAGHNLKGQISTFLTT